MPKRSSKDVNELAKSIVGDATADKDEGKNPAAVELGRLGGQRGEPARAKKRSKSGDLR